VGTYGHVLYELVSAQESPHNLGDVSALLGRLVDLVDEAGVRVDEVHVVAVYRLFSLFKLTEDVVFTKQRLELRCEFVFNSQDEKLNELDRVVLVLLLRVQSLNCLGSGLSAILHSHTIKFHIFPRIFTTFPLLVSSTCLQFRKEHNCAHRDR